MPEPRRDHVDRDHGHEIDRQHPPQAARALQPPRECEQEDAEDDRLDRLHARETEGAHGKQVHRDQFGRCRNRERGRRHGGGAQPKAGTATDCDPGKHDGEQDEGHGARGKHEEDQPRDEPAPPGLQREQAEQREQDA